MPRIFANSILSNNADEAITRINTSQKFDALQKTKAIRIIKKLFSSKSKRLSTEEQAESRVDYISDQLGIPNEEIFRIIEILKEEKILAQTRDLTAFIKKGENSNRSVVVESYGKEEIFLLTLLKEEEAVYNLKEINERFVESGINDNTPNKLKTIINFWAIKNWIKRLNLEYPKNRIRIALTISKRSSGKSSKRHTCEADLRVSLQKINRAENWGKRDGGCPD